MRRIEDIAEYVFNQILIENPGFESLPYRSLETKEHLQKAVIKWSQAYFLDQEGKSFQDLEIAANEWAELAEILKDNIEHKGILSQGSALTIVDSEDNAFIFLEGLESLHMSSPVVSKVLGNFVKLKDKLTKFTTKNYYLAKRFESSGTKKGIMKLDLNKVQHKFVPALRNKNKFTKGQKVYSVFTGAEFEVVAEESNGFYEMEGPSGVKVTVNGHNYRESLDQIKTINKDNQVFEIGDFVEIKEIHIHTIMKQAAWDDLKDPDYHIWANVLKAHKAKIVEIRASHVILNFIGANLGDFRDFDFYIHADYIVSNKRNHSSYQSPYASNYQNKYVEEDKAKKEKEEAEEKERENKGMEEDRLAGPYDFSDFENKIIRIVKFNKKFNGDMAKVSKVDNQLGRLHLTLENDKKIVFRAGKYPESIELVGEIIVANF